MSLALFDDADRLEPEIRFVVGLLVSGLRDLMNEIRRTARTGKTVDEVMLYSVEGRWILSDSDDPMTCRWCCVLLNRSHDDLKRRVLRDWREIAKILAEMSIGRTPAGVEYLGRTYRLPERIDWRAMCNLDHVGASL